MITRINELLGEGERGYCKCEKPAESIPSAGKLQVCVICDKPIKKADVLDFLNHIIATQEMLIFRLIKQNNELCNLIEREFKKNGEWKL